MSAHSPESVIPDSTSRPTEFPPLLDRVHVMGREIIGPAAVAVDRDARFPQEAFAALKAEKLLSAYVPIEFGGMGLSITELSRICEALGQYCASTAMVFAMHQIQVGCIVHHALGAAFFRDYMATLVAKQHLLASATTELGIGGDLRSSICAVRIEGDRFTIEKQAPVISYGETADAILVTSRKSEDAARSDQVVSLVLKQDYTLQQVSSWDTIGFRGTCSPGFLLTARGRAEQILPVPYAGIHSQTMHPFAHIVWASLWLGIATDALHRARVVVRGEARKTPGTAPISATRLAEADTVLFAMRSGLQATTAEYQRLLLEDNPEAFSNFGFSIRINNLKLASANFVIDIVTRAMLICGIVGYRNDSKLSLSRHVRDAFGASVMVNNDRILGHNATMHMGQRDSS